MRICKKLDKQQNILPILKGFSNTNSNNKTLLDTYISNITNNKYYFPSNESQQNISLYNFAKNNLQTNDKTIQNNLPTILNNLQSMLQISHQLNQSKSNKLPNITKIQPKNEFRIENWKNTVLFDHPMLTFNTYFDPNIAIGINFNNNIYEGIILNHKSGIKVSDIINIRYGTNAKRIMQDIVFCKTSNGVHYVPEMFYELPLYYGGPDQSLTHILVKTDNLHLANGHTNIFNGKYALNPDLPEIEALIESGYLSLNDVKFIHGKIKWDLNKFYQILDNNEILCYQDKKHEIIDILWNQDIDNDESIWYQIFKKCSDIDIIQFMQWYNHAFKANQRIR